MKSVQNLFLNRIVIGAVLLATCAQGSDAQVTGVWNGKKCAVSLTYDDALNVHLDKVVPALDSLGLRGTFYLSGFFPSFQSRSTEWKAVAGKGHELGNHTLFHPCDGTLAGREWVKTDYDLSKYTVRRMVDEISMANILLNMIDGKSTRTFAYPCGEMEAGGVSYVDHIQADFAGARGVDPTLEQMGDVNLSAIGSYMIAGQSGEELVALVKQAMGRDALVVFLFHGVGGEHSLNVSLEAHTRLLHYLKENERDIWVAPVVEVAEYVKERRKQNTEGKRRQGSRP